MNPTGTAAFWDDCPTQTKFQHETRVKKLSPCSSFKTVLVVLVSVLDFYICQGLIGTFYITDYTVNNVCIVSLSSSPNISHVFFLFLLITSYHARLLGDFFYGKDEKVFRAKTNVPFTNKAMWAHNHKSCREPEILTLILKTALKTSAL